MRFLTDDKLKRIALNFIFMNLTKLLFPLLLLTLNIPGLVVLTVGTQSDRVSFAVTFPPPPQGNNPQNTGGAAIRGTLSGACLAESNDDSKASFEVLMPNHGDSENPSFMQTSATSTPSLYWYITAV